MEQGSYQQRFMQNANSDPKYYGKKKNHRKKQSHIPVSFRIFVADSQGLLINNDKLLESKQIALFCFRPFETILAHCFLLFEAI